MAELRDDGPPHPLSAVYVHVPFCRDRCTYCAFPTVGDDPARHAELVDALRTEWRRAAAGAGVGPSTRLRTVYLGGGTPGLLAPLLLAALLDDMRSLVCFQHDVEVTLEVNPANVSAARLAEWTALGVTRLSVGVQTFDDVVLHGLARRHDAACAEAALSEIAMRWPGTWSADLLVGWHGQDAARLADDVRRLLRHEPPHVSIYGLTLEHGTVLARQAARGRAVAVTEDVAVGLDEAWSEHLGACGYERYEVSNFARPGHRSRHNQAYWSNASYLGLGPGACSAVHPHRWTNRADLEGYLRAVARGWGRRVAAERLDPARRLLESLAIGLRTADGLPVAELDRRFGPAWRPLVEPAARPLIAEGWLALDAEHLAVPARHLTKADRIMLELARGLQDATDLAGDVSGAGAGARAAPGPGPDDANVMGLL